MIRRDVRVHATRGRPDAPDPAQRPAPVRRRGRGRRAAWHGHSAAAALEPRPLAVLLTGDIADEPAAEVYERAHRMVAELGIPIHAIPGNHDDRDLLARTFAGREHATGAPVHVLAYVEDLRLVGCDTTVPGQPRRRPRPRSAAAGSTGRSPTSRRVRRCWRSTTLRSPPASWRWTRSGSTRPTPRGSSRCSKPTPRSRPHLRPRPPHGRDGVRRPAAADLPEHQLDAAPGSARRGGPAAALRRAAARASPCTSSRTGGSSRTFRRSTPADGADR